MPGGARESYDAANSAAGATTRAPGVRSGSARAPSSRAVAPTPAPGPSSVPKGWQGAEVEIDPATGVVRIVRYTGVNDFGTIVNPMIVAGQLHGGVVQGIGQALMAKVNYD